MLRRTGSYASAAYARGLGECAEERCVQRCPFQVHASEKNVVRSPPNRTTSCLVLSYAIAGLKRGLGASGRPYLPVAKAGACRRTSGNPGRSNAAADAWRNSRRVSILSAISSRYRRTASKRCVTRSASLSANGSRGPPPHPVEEDSGWHSQKVPKALATPSGQLQVPGRRLVRSGCGRKPMLFWPQWTPRQPP